MPTIDEAIGSNSALADALAAGIADISQHRAVPFATYTKRVLPLDGFVFWLRAGQFEQYGMLHWMTAREQAEDETATRNSVVFTTTAEIQCLNETNTQLLVVGSIEGRKYAFGRIGWYAPQANVWHYQGEALHPAAATQLIDRRSQLNPDKLILSGSMPAWLQLYNYNPIWLDPLNPKIMLYPSFLVPDNLEPPWGAVHIDPSGTRALQAIPTFDRYTSTHRQLTAERVRVTLYGCNNDMAADWMDLAERYSLDTDAFGLMNMPTLVDEHRPWPEGMVLAQKKTVTFEVSYFQTRINDIARQEIHNASAQVITYDQIAEIRVNG